MREILDAFNLAHIGRRRAGAGIKYGGIVISAITCCYGRKPAADRIYRTESIGFARYLSSSTAPFSLSDKTASVCDRS